MNFSDNALYSSDKKNDVEIKISNVGEKVRISVRDYGEELPISIWRAIKSKIIGQFRRVRVRKVPAWVYLLHKVLRLQWVQKLVLFGIATAAHFISI